LCINLWKKQKVFLGQTCIKEWLLISLFLSPPIKKLSTNNTQTPNKYPHFRKIPQIKRFSPIQKEYLVDKMGKNLGLGFCTRPTTKTKTLI
jgi:hypothetical protein